MYKELMLLFGHSQDQTVAELQASLRGAMEVIDTLCEACGPDFKVSDLALIRQGPVDLHNE